MKQTFSNSDDYNIIIQMESDLLFLHIDVVNWGKSVLKSIRQDMEKILDRTKAQGWGEVYAYTSNVKFANLVEPCEVVGPMAGHEHLTIVKWVTG
ncbi:MAG: hypothetical protein GQ574_14640 [Crocinitomix sp.]|nr:hypothetical protein [Crocinitomix sp.]